jgi:hypothetical protein
VTTTATAELASQAPQPETPPRSPVKGGWLPWLVMGLCVVAFAYGLPTIRDAGASEWGLLVSVSPAYGASILLAACAFVIALRQRSTAAAVTATILMVLVQRLPRSVSTDVPMYSWTYKHLGVVDWIQHSGSLAHGVDIYNSWPGCFALTAWFSDLTGVAPISIAHWFAVAFNLVFAVLIFAAARAWGLEPLTAVAAAFIVSSLNWVEQDYFSPQAIAVCLAAAILIPVGLSRERPVGMWLIFVLFAAMVITHQLTPYWIVLVVGLLAFTRHMKPWWIVLPLAAMLFGFLWYNWDEVSRYTLFSFNIFENIRTNVPTRGVPGQLTASIAMRVLSGSMWLATAVVLIYRWRKHRPFFALGVLALSPMLILAGQGYTGEAVFRVFLYSLIGCSFVLAPVLVAATQGSIARYLAGAAVALVAVAVAAHCYFANWYSNLMSANQVKVAQTLQSQAELPAYLTPLSVNWPERGTWHYVDYRNFSSGFDTAVMFAPELWGSHFASDEEYAKFMDAVGSRTDASTYLILTDQMSFCAWYFGILPRDAAANLKDHLSKDPRWERFYDDGEIAVYQYHVRIE